MLVLFRDMDPHLDLKMDLDLDPEIYLKIDPDPDLDLDLKMDPDLDPDLKRSIFGALSNPSGSCIGEWESG
jgi:hypothetical protein